MPVLYLNEKNISLNQINNVEKKSLSFKKGKKRYFLNSNTFIFVLKVFSLRIEEIKLKKRFLKFK